jgi:Leucine-rich repeat (LRR) protein
MKKLKSSIIALSFAVSVQVCSTRLVAGPFPDKNLELAVRAELIEKRDPATELTDDDLKKVFFLEGKGKGIKDLSGFEKCTNAAEVNLAKNEIADVTPLAGLANLQSLDLSSNKLADVTPLEGLANLQYLELSHNQLAKLPALDKMTRMSSLYLADNQLSDLTPLAKLTKLSSLDLAKNKVTNLAPLAEIKRFMTLKLSDNAIEDISVLANCKQLSMLFLERNKLTDLAPLVTSAKADAEGEKRFAPYLRLYLADNPLSDAAKNEQLATLKGIGVRIDPPAQ